MEQREKIGALIYTIITAAAGNKSITDFLPRELQSHFYHAAQGQSLGAVTVNGLSKCCPQLKGCVNFAWRNPKLTAKGQALFDTLEAAGKLRAPGESYVRTRKTKKTEKALTPAKPVPSGTNFLSAFEMGCLVSSYSRRPEAKLWLEMIETAKAAGLEIGDIAKALHAGGANG